MRILHNTATARRRWLLLAFPPLAALALTVALVAHASAAPTFSINLRIPVSGATVVNPCNGSNVTISGDEHIMGQVGEETLPDGVVGVHAVFHNNTHFSGTDNQGNAYVGNGTEDILATGQLTADGQIVFEEDSLPIDVVIVSQGAAPNFTEHVSVHITLTPNGTITAAEVHLSETCQG